MVMVQEKIDWIEDEVEQFWKGLQLDCVIVWQFGLLQMIVYLAGQIVVIVWIIVVCVYVYQVVVIYVELGIVCFVEVCQIEVYVEYWIDEFVQYWM